MESQLKSLKKPIQLGRLDADRSVLRQHDLLDLQLRLAQLRLAMALQRGAALIRLDRVVELVVAALQPLDQSCNSASASSKLKPAMSAGTAAPVVFSGPFSASKRMPPAPKRRRPLESAAFYPSPPTAARPAGGT
jgi:hypothetical protein